MLGSTGDPLTVGQLNRLAKETIEQTLGQIWVRGELTAMSKPSSGHWYFTLKDEAAQISCALFKYRVPREPISVGSEVLVLGMVTLYEQRGQYQMVVESIVPWGMGQRHAQFEAVKKKLYEQGLLDSVYKKELPRFPKCIGIISSAQAAGFQDVLVILKRRYPLAKVRFYPTLVQGSEAVEGLLRCLDQVDRDAVLLDVVMMVRGGGSSEDLWCFNDERLARRIFELKVPIITGIGHEIDTTLADLVADVRAPTPSAASELVVPDQAELFIQLDRWRHYLQKIMCRHIERLWLRLDGARSRVIHPKNYLLLKRRQFEQDHLRLKHVGMQRISIERYKVQKLEMRLATLSPYRSLQQTLVNLEGRLQQALRTYLDRITHRLQQHRQILAARDPEKLLRDGWSWVEGLQGRLHDIHDLSEGSRWRIWVLGGCADMKVEKQMIVKSEYVDKMTDCS